MDNCVGMTAARHTCLAEMNVGIAGDKDYEKVHKQLKVRI